MWLHKYYIDNLTFTGFPVWRKLPSHLSEAEAEVLERRRELPPLPPQNMRSASLPAFAEGRRAHAFVYSGKTVSNTVFTWNTLCLER